MTRPIIRPAQPADLPGLVALQNAALPEEPTSLAVQEFREANRKPGLAFGRLVAERGGRVTGVASYVQPEWATENGKLWVAVTVHPEARGQGLGAALYDALKTAMRPHHPQRLGGVVREDRPEGLHFAFSRGFVEVAREQEAELGLAHLDSSWRDDACRKTEEGGYETLSFDRYIARVGDDLAWARLYDLDVDASRDEPQPPGESIQMPTLDRYRQSQVDHPDFDPSLWFVAVRGEEVAAVSQLSRTESPDVMNTGFTGVARAHRGDRLAWALKYLALAEADRRGAVRVRTSNAANNAPMRNINTGLGFRPTPAYLTLSLDLSP